MQTNTDKSFSLLTVLFRVGLSSWISRVSFILQWVSDRPFANISKWSHFKLWPVDVTWSAIADAWQVLVIPLKCSVLDLHQFIDEFMNFHNFMNLLMQLKTCINKFYGCIDLRVIFQSARRIKSFFPYKDIINRSQMSKVV